MFLFLFAEKSELYKEKHKSGEIHIIVVRQIKEEEKVWSEEEEGNIGVKNVHRSKKSMLCLWLIEIRGRE